MKITVKQTKMVQIKFVGKINMSQEIIISKRDAQKLSKILASEKASTFETE